MLEKSKLPKENSLKKNENNSLETNTLSNTNKNENNSLETKKLLNNQEKNLNINNNISTYSEYYIKNLEKRNNNVINESSNSNSNNYKEYYIANLEKHGNNVINDSSSLSSKSNYSEFYVTKMEETKYPKDISYFNSNYNNYKEFYCYHLEKSNKNEYLKKIFIPQPQIEKILEEYLGQSKNKLLAAAQLRKDQIDEEILKKINLSWISQKNYNYSHYFVNKNQSNEIKDQTNKNSINKITHSNELTNNQTITNQSNELTNQLNNKKTFNLEDLFSGILQTSKQKAKKIIASQEFELKANSDHYKELLFNLLEDFNEAECIVVKFNPNIAPPKNFEMETSILKTALQEQPLKKGVHHYMLAKKVDDNYHMIAVFTSQKKHSVFYNSENAPALIDGKKLTTADINDNVNNLEEKWVSSSNDAIEKNFPCLDRSPPIYLSPENVEGNDKDQYIYFINPSLLNKTLFENKNLEKIPLSPKLIENLRNLRLNLHELIQKNELEIKQSKDFNELFINSLKDDDQVKDLNSKSVKSPNE